MRPQFSSSISILPCLFLLAVVGVKSTHGVPDCDVVSLGDPVHHFNHYMEASYNISCEQLCKVPVPRNLLELIQLKAFFSPNDTQVSCSWLIQGFQNESLSTVMFFEQSRSTSLAHGILCDKSTPSLSVWDEYSLGGDVQNTYNICRNANDDAAVTYSRRSSRLGNYDTLITLKDFNVSHGMNPTLFKYITVDWAQDCPDDYRQISVNGTLMTTALGAQWFTSNLRFPNEMHCRWHLSTPASSNDMIRVRVRVLGRTPIPGPCVGDDYILIKDSQQTKNPIRFTLCDDSAPFFFPAFTGSVHLDFFSQSHTGAPEFKFSYSALSACPGDSLSVFADTVVNAVFMVSDPGLSSTACTWNLVTNWTNDVVMLTRLDHQQFLQDCTDSDYLDIDLGTSQRRVSLCGDVPMPLWSDEHAVEITLHHTRRSRRQAVVYYKSVRKVPACQGIPLQLEASSSQRSNLLVDLTVHRQHLDVSAPTCQWLVVPSSQVSNQEDYAAEVRIAESGVKSGARESNKSMATWMMSGFRAYPGTVANGNSSLRVNCNFVLHAVECTLLSSNHSLLLVYDPRESTSPIPIDRVSFIFRETKKVSSGQTGSVLRSWHAQLGAMFMTAVLMLLLF